MTRLSPWSRSTRDRWFDELERRGIDPWEDEVPAAFQDDRRLASLPRDRRTGTRPTASPAAGPRSTRERRG
ncbi:hypothetical protein E6U81_00750 [Streptomyces sp. A0592]|nr:hypothetical protein E6U81_00750 [Streptomyces sp. A0592]